MKKMKKALLSAAAAVSTAAATTVTALASTPSASDEATTALQTGFTSMVGDITGVIIAAIPIAMGLIGLVVAIRFGIRWFRGLVSRT